MYKVIKKFRDKYTKKVYNVGTEYLADKNRLAELEKLGYIKEKKEPKAAEK